MSKQFEQRDVERRAQWLAWKHGADKQRVMRALLRTEIRVDTELSTDISTFLEFTPSLERALLYLRSEVALRLFERGAMDSIVEWLERTEQLAGSCVESRPTINDLCDWEAEVHI